MRFGKPLQLLGHLSTIDWVLRAILAITAGGMAGMIALVQGAPPLEAVLLGLCAVGVLWGLWLFYRVSKTNKSAADLPPPTTTNGFPDELANLPPGGGLYISPYARDMVVEDSQFEDNARWNIVNQGQRTTLRRIKVRGTSQRNDEARKDDGCEPGESAKEV